MFEELEDEAELDDFCVEAEVFAMEIEGKIDKIELLLTKFDKLSTTNSQPHYSQSFSRSKLPDLNLPTFDGNITEWFGFWERFQSQVGNSPDLPNTAKLTYLVGQLRGEALDTVKGIIPSELNYGVLEETLKENFGLPRRIIRAHIMNLLKIPKPTPFAASIRQFYNSVMGDIRSLEALNVNIAAFAPFIIPIIEEKLPVKACSAIGDCGEEFYFNLQLFVENFKKFLAKEEQSQALQPVARHEIYEPPSVTSTLVTSSDLRCQFCTGPHNTHRCSQSASEKRATIIRKRLCFNWFWSLCFSM